jgi:hypothetical protein
MKITRFVFTFLIFSIATVQATSNTLEDACGYEVLPSQNIQAMYTWSGVKNVCIGFDEESVSSETLVATQLDHVDFQNELEHLAAISFEPLEESPISSKKIFIAEREEVIRGESYGEPICTKHDCPVKSIGACRSNP